MPVRRHPIALDRGRLPCRVVVEPTPWPPPFQDRGACAGEETSSRMDALRADLASTRFDLSSGPLLVAASMRKSARRHVLPIVMHHAITDGWSSTVIRRDLLAFHGARSRDRPAERPDPVIQFGDFAVHRRRWSEAEGASARSSAYRRRTLHAVPAPAVLPATLRARPGPSHRPATIRTTSRAKSLSSLDRRATDLRSTPFCVLASALFVVLNRYTGSADLVIGTPMAGREQVEVEDLVGFFVNDVLLRYRIEGRPAFRDVVTELDGIVLGARQHQNFPFLKLVEMLRPSEGLSHDPLFQIWFAYHHFPAASDRAGALSVKTCPVDKIANWTGVAVEFTRLADGLELAVTFAADRYDAAFIEQFTRHYLSIVDAALACPDETIEDLEMISPGEREQLVAAGRGPSRAFEDTTVVELFRRNVATRPGAVAVEAGDASLTFSELARRVDEIVGHLALPPGGTVGVALPRGPDLVAALLAVLASGCSYLPLDASYPSDRLTFMLADSGAATLITHSALADALPTATPRILVDRLEPKPSGARPSPEGPAPGDTAYVIYTSGSTGTPKGVRISHHSLANVLFATESNPGFGSSDRFLSVTTVSFDIATLEIFLPLASGGTLIMAGDGVARDPQALIALVASTSPTVMQATPSTWRLLVDAGWKGCSGLRAWCGGERLPTPLARALLTRVDELFNMYGPTETTIWSAAERCSGTGTSNGSEPLGGVLANTQILILDGSGRPVPRGVDGELFIGGRGVALGYHGRPELTAERFVRPPLPELALEDRFYRTGDLGRWIGHGRIAFSSRVDRQVKLRGVRVELGEIEAALVADGLVTEAVADVFDDGAGSQSLVAYVVAKDRTPVDNDVMEERLRRRLPSQYVPNRFVWMDALPRTKNAKIDHAALPRPATSVPATRQTDGLGDVADRIHAIWSRLLGGGGFGVDDNFFRIGGHSLVASRMIHDVGRVFSIDAPLRLAYEAPTIAALARRVSEMAGQKPAPL